MAASQKRYTDAAQYYQQLKKQMPNSYPQWIEERANGFNEVASLLNDSSLYSIQLLQVNTPQQDFSPQYFKGGLVFVSNRYSKNTEKEFGWDGLPFSNIYWVKDTAELFTVDTIPARIEKKYKTAIKVNDDYTATTSNDNNILLVNYSMRSSAKGAITKLEKFTDALDTKYNYGPLCFNSTGNVVYFTRNALKPYKDRYNLEICKATLGNNGWGPVKVLPFVEQAYDYFHPALNKDGSKLFFSSNKPGGIGGNDLYYVLTENDSLMHLPVLLDTTINTPGDELFPTFSGDTLFFSSDGHAGLGGLDIYKTRENNNHWEKPQNMGYPINSSYDDFGIIYNPTKNGGLFSSNRLGSDDLFKFNHLASLIKLSGTVLDKSTMRRLDSAKVVITEIVNQQIIKDSVITDFTGNYHFPLLQNHAYTLSFSKPGYTNDSAVISKIEVRKDIDLAPALLAPIPKALPLPDRDHDGVEDKKDKCPDKKGLTDNGGCPDIQSRLNELAKMVFFKTASAELSPAALKPLNEAVAILLEYPNTTLEIEGHTDNKAGVAYNQDLSQRRAASVKNFFVAKGIKANRFTSVIGYGLTRPIADNNTEEGRAMNRRVSIKATFIF
jgi:outer membrane protein OmpA-like peptidoglycan-associated protein/tetratricopeptide (TPR) repeat protein